MHDKNLTNDNNSYLVNKISRITHSYTADQTCILFTHQRYLMYLTHMYILYTAFKQNILGQSAFHPYRIQKLSTGLSG